MIPEKKALYIDIPVTFDSTSKPGGLGNDKFILAGVIMLFWLITVILSLFIELTIFQKILYFIGSLAFFSTIVRFLVLKENYFMKRRNELIEKEYKYPYSTFWNIYEITDVYPYICRYANGLKSCFVMFEKDVIVGREEDNDYYHYEAIAEAYLQMYKRNMDCMHIDYMDTVGKDDRTGCLFEMAKNSENPILSDTLTRMFDHVQTVMQNSYASYDVYCFFYNGKDELFRDELDYVINSFLEANYIRHRVLDKDEVGELVKSIYNLDEFSVNFASEKLFNDIGTMEYLRPIWIERGEERVILNKTREELEEERRVREAEKEARKSKIKPKGRTNRMVTKLKAEEELDLFDENDYYDDINNQSQVDYPEQYNEYNQDVVGNDDYTNQNNYNQNYNNQSIEETYYDEGEYYNNANGYYEDNSGYDSEEDLDLF